jgi:hypothetical protein
VKELLMAAALTAVPLAPAPAAGSAFSSVSLTSVASGASWVFSGTSQIPAETDVPYAATSIRLGAGQATATVAWPGETGAAFGSTLIVGFGAPESARVLNDPAYARAQSGRGPATVSNSSVPTGTMTAHATTTDTSAASSVDGASTLATTTGAARSTSAARIVSASDAVVEGATSIRDVTVAGVVHVGSVVSSARATTDGSHADAEGTTTVTGLSVAGQAVSIDEHGITVAGTSVPAGAALDAVEAALAQAQVTLTLSRPVRIVSAGRVEYATGALIVSTPLGVLSLGGVQLRAGATLGDPLRVPMPAAIAPAGGQPADGTDQSGSPDVVPGTTDVPSTPPSVVQQVVRALLPTSLTTGYGWGWVVLGLALAAGAATALSGLPSRWLPALEDRCPLEKSL